MRRRLLSLVLAAGAVVLTLAGWLGVHPLPGNANIGLAIALAGAALLADPSLFGGSTYAYMGPWRRRLTPEEVVRLNAIAGVGAVVLGAVIGALSFLTR